MRLPARCKEDSPVPSVRTVCVRPQFVVLRCLGYGGHHVSRRRKKRQASKAVSDGEAMAAVRLRADLCECVHYPWDHFRRAQGFFSAERYRTRTGIEYIRIDVVS